MTNVSDNRIKLTNRVRLALSQACKIIAWAAKPEDPVDVLNWIESVEITDILPFDVIEGSPFYHDQLEAGVKKTPYCQIDVQFEIDRDPRKKFSVILDMVDTARSGWCVFACRSGEPNFWHQMHYANGYDGIRTKDLILINSNVGLEKDAAKHRLFQFPFRDLPAVQ